MNSNPSLTKQVLQDIFHVGRFPLILLILVLVTSLGTVYITQQTRSVVARHDELQSEREQLDVEWHNLMLEEYSLSEHSKIEAIAREQLNMIRPDGQHEIIVSQ